LNFDPKHRYGTSDRVDPYDEASELLDPFERLHLDIDTTPKPTPPGDRYRERQIPEGSWDAFTPTRVDYEESGQSAIGSVRGAAAGTVASLPPRMVSIGVWIQRVAHMPVALWWAAHQTGLHPDIKRSIASLLHQEPERFPKNIGRGWRLLFAAWDDERPAPDMQRYEIEARARQDGWTQSLLRELAGMYRPRLKVKQRFDIRHPLSWIDGAHPDSVISADVDYPHPHQSLPVRPIRRG
jgi:hypothetical protein